MITLPKINPLKVERTEKIKRDETVLKLSNLKEMIDLQPQKSRVISWSVIYNLQFLKNFSYIELTNTVLYVRNC